MAGQVSRPPSGDEDRRWYTGRGWVTDTEMWRIVHKEERPPDPLGMTPPCHEDPLTGNRETGGGGVAVPLSPRDAEEECAAN